MDLRCADLHFNVIFLKEAIHENQNISGIQRRHDVLPAGAVMQKGLHPMKKKIGKILCIAAALLLVPAIVIQLSPLVCLLNRSCAEVCVSEEESGYYDLFVEKDYLQYHCYVTLKNLAEDEKTVYI